MKPKIIYFLLIFLTLFSCKEPEARRPKSKSTTNFYKEVIAKNKQLIKQETRFIENIIKLDTASVYKPSANGFWYTYITKIEENRSKATSEDVVEIDFDVTDLKGNVIYPKQKRTYKIDKEDFIPAIEDGIKLMKLGETITFVIPSYRAYGVTGDENKIKPNQAIKSTVTLININSNIKNEN